MYLLSLAIPFLLIACAPTREAPLELPPELTPAPREEAALKAENEEEILEAEGRYIEDYYGGNEERLFERFERPRESF